MADLHIEPPEESEQITAFGVIFLRVGAVFLCALLGLLLVLLGYMSAILMNLDLEEFSMNTSVYFSISLVLWILIGLSAPFALFQRFFEELKGVTFGRIVAFIVIAGTFVILHWYVITIATELLVTVIGPE